MKKEIKIEKTNSLWKSKTIKSRVSLAGDRYIGLYFGDSSFGTWGL